MPGFNGGLGLRDMSNLGLESCASAKGLRGDFALEAYASRLFA